MDLLNISLDKMRENKGGRISLIEMLSISIQLINCLEKLHNIGIIHRDIKPENIMTSLRENTLYLIDFGISRYYINQDRIHIPINSNKKLIGNVRYASLNIHNGIEPSRRDDLISLGYIFILCLKGELPWQNINSSGISKDEKYIIIKNIKETTSLIDLCSNIPYEFLSYMSYCYSLEFDEEPNYKYIRTLFVNLLNLLNNEKK
jgi:serine/threonine protein kinase